MKMSSAHRSAFFLRFLPLFRHGTSLSMVSIALFLSACGGGSSGGYSVSSEEVSDASAGESESEDHANEADKSGEPRNLLPGTSFMPKGFMQAEVEIDGSTFALQLTCFSASYTAECFRGDVSFSSVRFKESASEPEQWNQYTDFSGSWEQMGEGNTMNRVNGLYIDSVWGSTADVRAEALTIDIIGREDDASQTDSTIILRGTVSSGALFLEGVEEASLSGATVRLIYTIAPGHINATTHGTH